MCSHNNIPNLKLDIFLINHDHASTELDTNRKIVNGLEALVSELQQQARLADTGITNDDILEQVGITHT